MHLRKRYPGLPIIFWTGAAEAVEIDRKALEDKTEATVVFKDVRDQQLDDLLARVQDTLG